MTTTFRKWWAIFGIYFQDGLAYRASGLIWIMTDLVTAVTMPLVWANASKAGMIAGFSTSDFVLYYLCMLLVGCFVTSHMMWDIAIEIREGQFTTQLIRPIGIFPVVFFRNMAWRIIRTGLFLPIFVMLLFAYRGYLGHAEVHVGWAFWLALLGGHFVSFTFVMLMSSIALYVSEATSIFELYYVPMLFLSGQLFPVSVLPTWAKNLSMLFPFYYTTGAPTEILIGRVSGDAVIRVLGAQLVWITVSYVASKLMWKRGLRHYSAIGM